MKKNAVVCEMPYAQSINELEQVLKIMKNSYFR